MKKYFLIAAYTILLFALNNCTQPIALKNMSMDEPGYFMYGKIPQRTFYEDVQIGEIVEKWNNETAGSHSNSSVIIFNNTVFVSDLSGRIYAFDKTNGKMLGYEKFNGSIETTPIVYKLRLIFVLNEKLENYSTLVVFDFMNGKILNETKIYGGVSNQLLRLEDGIIALTDNGELIKFDFTGNEVWSVKTFSYTSTSPASDGNIIIFGNQKGELIIVSADGEIKSKINFKHALTSGMIIENTSLYFANNTGVLYSFDLNEEKINWSFGTGYKILSTPALDKENVYAGNLNGDFFSLDKNTGKLNWQIRTNGIINTTPLITNDFIVQPNVDKKVMFINPSNGTIENTIEFDRRTKLTPVLYDSLLFLGSDRGILHAYKIYGMN